MCIRLSLSLGDIIHASVQLAAAERRLTAVLCESFEDLSGDRVHAFRGLNVEGLGASFEAWPSSSAARSLDAACSIVIATALRNMCGVMSLRSRFSGGETVMSTSHLRIASASPMRAEGPRIVSMTSAS